MPAFKPAALRAIALFLPVAAAVTVLAGVMYAGLQQTQRQGADDPQIQLAEDAAARLAAGDEPARVVPADKVEISRSLAPFVLVFDSGGGLVAGSGVLHGQPPSLPPGVFDYARQNGTNRLTWEPEPGTRSAIVVVPYKHGFVVAGRSLREVEQRERYMELLMLGGWAAAIAAAAVGAAGGGLLMSWRF